MNQLLFGLNLILTGVFGSAFSFCYTENSTWHPTKQHSCQNRRFKLKRPSSGNIIKPTRCYTSVQVFNNLHNISTHKEEQKNKGYLPFFPCTHCEKSNRWHLTKFFNSINMYPNPIRKYDSLYIISHYIYH